MAGREIIIAKRPRWTELANWVAGPPTPMPANYSAPRRLHLQPVRTPDGISARNAHLRWPAGPDDRRLRASGVGNGLRTSGPPTSGPKTSGSILSPAKPDDARRPSRPTVGRISRYGVIPITADQDTPGPMAKSVTDAAISARSPSKGRFARSRNDSRDGAGVQRRRDTTNTIFLNRNGLKRRGGALGSLEDSSTRTGGFNDDQRKVTEGCYRRPPVSRVPSSSTPADIPSIVDPDPRNKPPALGNLRPARPTTGSRDENCSIVLKYGMKRDFNQWLAFARGGPHPSKTLGRPFANGNLAPSASRHAQNTVRRLSIFRTRMDVEARSRAVPIRVAPEISGWAALTASRR